MRKLLLALALLWSLPATAQITNHAQPIGRGSGVIGWGIAGPCAANQWLVYLTGTGADPSCASAGSAFGVQSANRVFAGPTTGAAANPTFRALVGADLPNPSSTTLGGIQSTVGATHQWIATISTGGVPGLTQPACADLSTAGVFCSSTDAAGLTGTVASARISGSYTGITGVGTLTTGTIGSGFTAITYANQATAAANTMTGNWTGSTASKADNAMPSCADSGTNHLNYVSGTGITCGTVSGTMVLLNTLTASNSATLVDTTSLTATYSNYLIIFENILPASSSTILQLLVHEAGTFPAANYVTQITSFATTTVTALGSVTTYIPLNTTGTIQNNGAGISGQIRVSAVSQTTIPKIWWGEFMEQASGPVAKLYVTGGWWTGGNNAIDGFQVSFSSGNITSGVIKVYGVL